MAYQLIRHPRVEEDLDAIVQLLVDYAVIDTARRKLNDIEKTLISLQHTPHIGSLRHDTYPDLRAIPTARKGVICFTIDEAAKEIFIICIAYAGREWGQKIQQRQT